MSTGEEVLGGEEPMVLNLPNEHFPMTLVWCPIPRKPQTNYITHKRLVLTWLIPFIGHVGIVNSRGEINDFAGPYYVNVHYTARR